VKRLAALLLLPLIALMLAGCETRFTNGYTTAYDWWDNNPPQSAEIAYPTIHQTAGGTGTYADPITIAADDTQLEGGQTLQFPAGTIFYIPNVRAYFIVEDRTGEIQQDNTAQHNGTNPHLDMWADGRTSTQSNAFNCMANLTHEGVLIIKDPNSNYVVVPGPLSTNNQCRQNYGNTVVTS
jgi:hypothetical protein